MTTGEVRLRRFTPVQRLFHLGLIVLFMLLSVTGVALMFTETVWGSMLSALFGGYVGVLEWHRLTGLALIAGFVVNMAYMLWLVDWRNIKQSILGPDSLMILGRDLKEMVRHLGWIFGLNKAPRFERWTWWGKFDYWAVVWGMIILGGTGLFMYDPVLTSDYLPGWLFNVSLWIHRIEAVLAMAHIFTVHFFVEHFRPSKLPFNASMFDGGMSEGHIKEEHAEWYERMQREGRLNQEILDQVPVPLRIVYFGFGYLMIILGIYLLIYGLLNVALLAFYGI